METVSSTALLNRVSVGPVVATQEKCLLACAAPTTLPWRAAPLINSCVSHAPWPNETRTSSVHGRATTLSTRWKKSAFGERLRPLRYGFMVPRPPANPNIFPCCGPNVTSLNRTKGVSFLSGFAKSIHHCERRHEHGSCIPVSYRFYTDLFCWDVGDP